MTQIHPNLICRKCRVPFEFHSTQIVGIPHNPRSVSVFECRECGRLTAEELQQLKAA
jgi:RNase P subunit RPR2